MDFKSAAPVLRASNGRTRSAYLGLGSNLGDRAARLWEAVACLQRAPGCTVVRVSRLYETEPVGPVPQPWFLNAVVGCRVRVDPFTLLGLAKGIETEMGRHPGVRWGPRPVDIDLLLYDHVEVHTDLLILPHPEMWNRRFVLVPLLDVLDGPRIRSRVSKRLGLLGEAPLVRPYEPGL